MQPCGAVEAVDISGNRGAHLQDIGLSPQMAQSAFLQLPGEMIFYYNFVVLNASNRFVVITEKKPLLAQPRINVTNGRPSLPEHLVRRRKFDERIDSVCKAAAQN